MGKIGEGEGEGADEKEKAVVKCVCVCVGGPKMWGLFRSSEKLSRSHLKNYPVRSVPG